VAVRVRDHRIAGSTLAPVGECPRCETQRRRGEPPRESPQVWYDTMIGDWVVQLPIDPDGPAFDDPLAEASTAVLPLGVPFYDAPPAMIYRAAADLVYAGEALDAVA
jgi:hypothetical protein